jgi:hypothetical protein
MIIADWYPVDYDYLGPAPSKVGVDAHTLCKCTVFLADNFQMTFSAHDIKNISPP